MRTVIRVKRLANRLSMVISDFIGGSRIELAVVLIVLKCGGKR